MRKLLPFLCIIFLLTSCIFGVLYFLSSKNNDTEIVEEIVVNTTELRSSVESGTITSKLEVDGNVIGDAPDIYIDNITIKFANDSDKSSFKTDYKIGDVLKKTDVLCSTKKKKYKVKGDSKIVDIIKSDESVKFILLNYDKLYIVGKIEIDKLDLLDFDTKTTILVKDGASERKLEAKIINWGYEVEDNKIDVFIHTDENLLPGTPVKIIFEITHKNESLYILKQMLMKEADSYYVEVESSNGERIRKDVHIGNFFEEYNDGEVIEYVEIISGLEVGERLIIDILE
jgi:hypothetical protein